MKKMLLSAGALALLLTSCGGSNEETVEVEQNASIVFHILQRSSRGTPASALSICLPHPAHVALPHAEHVSFQHIVLSQSVIK